MWLHKTAAAAAFVWRTYSCWLGLSSTRGAVRAATFTWTPPRLTAEPSESGRLPAHSPFHCPHSPGLLQHASAQRNGGSCSQEQQPLALAVCAPAKLRR